MTNDPIPPPPYFAYAGPTRGYALFHELPVCGVMVGPRGSSSVGIAWLNGSIPSRKGPVQLWRLEINKQPIEGDWVIKDQRFERISEGCEGLE